MALVTSGRPGRPRRLGFGSNRDRSNRAARSFSLGSEVYRSRWFRFSSLAKRVISLRTYFGSGVLGRRRFRLLGTADAWSPVALLRFDQGVQLGESRVAPVRHNLEILAGLRRRGQVRRVGHRS